NVDLNDIKAIMSNAGEAHIGIGEAAGPHRHMEAAKQAAQSPLLENVSIEGAKGMLVNFISDKKKLTHAEIKQAMEYIVRKVSPEEKIKSGKAYDDSLGDKLRITVIATGFPAAKARPVSSRTLRQTEGLFDAEPARPARAERPFGAPTAAAPAPED